LVPGFWLFQFLAQCSSNDHEEKEYETFNTNKPANNSHGQAQRHERVHRGKNETVLLNVFRQWGAFLVAKLFTEENAKRVLGGMSPEALAIGAILFTILMWRDIYLFGDMMKPEFLMDSLCSSARVV